MVSDSEIDLLKKTCPTLLKRLAGWIQEPQGYGSLRIQRQGGKITTWQIELSEKNPD